MSRVGHCIDNGPTEGLWGIIKSEMYCMYQITDEQSLRSVIDEYMKFYAEERLQERFLCKTPSEVRGRLYQPRTRFNIRLQKTNGLTHIKQTGVYNPDGRLCRESSFTMRSGCVRQCREQPLRGSPFTAPQTRPQRLIVKLTM